MGARSDQVFSFLSVWLAYQACHMTRYSMRTLLGAYQGEEKLTPRSLPPLQVARAA
jgi:hypothetical protein